MQINKIPKPLRLKIRRFMETLYSQRSGFDESEVLASLPPALGQELLDCLYRDQIKHFALFRAM
eukprot:SAG22_NODE_17543_length_303_cov_0.696078_1_plen_63_part_01